MIRGELKDTNSGGVGFSASHMPAFKRALGIGMRKVEAYACAHCRHLQLAVDFREEDLARYQSFEGRQPGVVERLAGDEEA
jgi:hypothetical protein